MISSSLHQPDDILSALEPHYSAIVAGDISSAYDEIHRGLHTPATYLRAAQRLKRYAHRRMSQRQRMRIFFILALGHSAAGATDEALACVDEALTAALAVHDTGATIELAYLRGTLHASLLKFREAVADYSFCLEELDLERKDEQQSADPMLHRELYLDLAFYDHALANFEASRRWLDLADQFILLPPEDPLAAAKASWVRCLLARWTGDTSAALGHGVASHAGYVAAGSPTSQARIKIVLADVALDLAAGFSPETSPRARQSVVALARPYVEQALPLAQQSHDGLGVGQAKLAYTRLQRMAGMPFDGRGTIEAVLSTAQQCGDAALLSQAYTAMGDELMHQRWTQPGLNCYRQALDSLAESDIPVIGVWPRRALLYASEMGNGS